MPSFERPGVAPESERAPIIMTEEEFKEIANADTGVRYDDESDERLADEEPDPKLVAWMEEHKVNFDSGHVVVEVNGERLEMNTSREDFGTV